MMSLSSELISEKIHFLIALGNLSRNISEEGIPEHRTKHGTLKNHVGKFHGNEFGTLDRDKPFPGHNKGIEKIKKGIR